MLNQGWVYRDRVKPSQAGLAVLDFYAEFYRHSTRQEWAERFENQQIFVDGKPATATQRLAKNQRLEYHRPPWEEPDVPLNFQILHQDPHFWIIDKPAGLPVLPAGNFLENTLLAQLKRQFPDETPVPIHRLGRGTSGLMILGRSPLGRQSLTRQLREHQITKIYRAVIPAGDYPDQITITTPIGKICHPSLGKIFAATADGLSAHSEMRVLERLAKVSRVEVQIFTGRPHQIRIHMAAMGFPLVGDRLYLPGGLPAIYEDANHSPLPGDCGYSLNAYYLKFQHPHQDKPIDFFSQLQASCLDF
ncbi:RluA family pseudouridine synthase [Picosynechococcus sp. PCC 73109]|uniref:RluA family pseudouridine synthase n=1 Tax=Picosynechococcus sp. PCC 73109 TaxID=374982 RepID=UPI00074586EB|nr:RluA family pseudouridine synthase [Picosynechococcus sp. PCC 73109]AMA09772.1 RNA pseudouridine synthase [Picosynechococcus sp. PCC 73109]